MDERAEIKGLSKDSQLASIALALELHILDSQFIDLQNKFHLFYGEIASKVY